MGLSSRPCVGHLESTLLSASCLLRLVPAVLSAVVSALLSAKCMLRLVSAVLSAVLSGLLSAVLCRRSCRLRVCSLVCRLSCRPSWRPFCVGPLVCEVSVTSCVGCLVGRLLGPPVCRDVGCPVGSRVCRLVGRLLGPAVVSAVFSLGCVPKTCFGRS